LDEAIATAETAVPAALAGPGVPVRAGWISLLFLANIGLWLAIYAPLQVLLPEQVQSLHDHVVKNNAVPSGTDAVLLSVVMGVGAIAGLVANPIVGALSDRTTSPRGRRHPWTALLTQVLPAAVDRGKDVGIINAGYNLPLVVAPLAAGVVLGLMNSYPALFALSGFVTIIATWTVTRVRSVR
jgi:hypothetical protein